jgi:hypothetical protein
LKIHTRELVLAALQLPLAGFIAGAANAQSPQQLERLEALVRAQAAQIDKLSLEMKTLKKDQSKTSQLAQPASPPAEKKVESKTSQQAQTASPRAVKTPGAMGSPQFGYPDYVVAGDKKLSWKLPGSDVSLRIGGYAKLDAIGITGGNRSVGANDQFNVFQIQTRGTPPTGNAPGDPSTNIHARQSRINI